MCCLKKHILLCLLLYACAGPPSKLDGNVHQNDIGAILDTNNETSVSNANIQIQFTRSFGLEGESLTHFLLPTNDSEISFLAFSNKAAYHLDSDARVIARTLLPVSTSGTQAVLLSLAWDKVDVGATLLWGQDEKIQKGTYLAIGNKQGLFDPLKMIPIGSSSISPLTSWASWDGNAYQVVWLEQKNNSLAMQLATIFKDGEKSQTTLKTGLSLDTQIGAWNANSSSNWSLCTTGLYNDRKTTLLYVFEKQDIMIYDLVPEDRTSTDRCFLAQSGLSHLVVFQLKGIEENVDADNIDAGPDANLTKLNFDRPVFQLVNPSGNLLQTASEITNHEGSIEIQNIIWDGMRYLVLFNVVSYKGGLLAVTIVSEDGLLLAKDLALPLPYEPGRVFGARLIYTGFDYALFWGLRRPWDQGLLYLTRFSLSAFPNH